MAQMSCKKQTRLLIALLLSGSLIPLPVAAQTSSSTSYRVEEAQFGSGGEVESCSGGQYCAQSSLGSLGVGSASSTNYDAEAGFLTQNEPYLEFVVNPSTIDLGTLTPTTTGTGTATFYVRTYLSGTYSVVTMSQPPTSEGGAVINAKSTRGVSAQGTEEFGMNLRANTAPATFGTDPVNVPSDSFADGWAFGDGAGGARDYDQPNEFAYGVGDTVARSQRTVGNQAVGRTDYTISYIANISPITEAGAYTMNHTLVTIATY